MKAKYKGIKNNELGPLTIYPRALKRGYGEGYREFSATLSKDNYGRLCQLVPTGQGKFGSAMINLAIELAHALLRGEDLPAVAERLGAAIGMDEEALMELAKTTMTLALALKVVADKVGGRSGMDEVKWRWGDGNYSA